MPKNKNSETTFWTRETLEDLLPERDQWCASIFIDTDAKQDTERFRIKLRNALSQAEKHLQDEGIRDDEIEDVLGPARERIEDTDFWTHQEAGLAIFASHDEYREMKTPIDVPDLTVLSTRYHVRPLVPLLEKEGRFWLMTLSQNEARLFTGTQEGLSEVSLGDAPNSLAEAMRFDQAEQQQQYHATDRASTPGGPRTSYHGHGQGEEFDKDRIRRFFIQMRDELQKQFKNDDAPLVLAGVEYMTSIFRDVSNYKHIADETIEGNYEQAHNKVLHQKAMDILSPRLTESRRAALESYNAMKAEGKALESIEDVVPAAFDGRVASLLVNQDADPLWGYYDSKERKVHIGEGKWTRHGDLINLAVAETLKNGGVIHTIDSHQATECRAVGAMLRY